MSDTKKDPIVLAPLVAGVVTSEPSCGRTSASRRKGAGSASPPSTASPASGSPVEQKKKMSYADLVNRTVFTILMAYVFLGFISTGIRFGVFLLLFICVTMFHEVTRIHYSARKERKLPSVAFTKWYFFLVCMTSVTFYTLREPIMNTFPVVEDVYDKLPMLFFCGIMAGLVTFVLSLRRGMYRYQFIQFTWTIMANVIITTQCAGGLSNMTRGMIWFLLPVSCVVINDIAAYVFGKLFGRTPLLALSPKKTLEGFLGAFVVTVLWAFWFCGFLGHFPEMYCPSVGFTNAVNAKCVQDPLFIQHEVAFPSWVTEVSGGRLRHFLASRAQFHALAFGTFASLVAPFGGFFASGLKRAFKLKDFGDLIPGHGGMTDRMDCQGLMELFTYVYLRTFMFRNAKCPSEHDLAACALQLPEAQRALLAQKLFSSLAENGGHL